MARCKIINKLAAAFLFLLYTAACAASGNIRVISLYPGHTENIAAIGAEKSIAAISHNDDLESLQNLPRLAAKVTPEAVLAHAPDILILRSLNAKSNPNLIPALEKAGVKVYTVEPPSWDEFDEYLKRLAEIIETNPQNALKRLAGIREKIEKTVTERGNNNNGKPRPSVFLEATGREIHTCAPDSWPARLIEMCGGVNAARNALPVRTGSAVAPWGAERAVELLASGLDVYIVQQGAMNAATRDDVLNRSWFSPFKENVRLEFVPERDLSRPSLVRLERGAEALLSIFAGTQPSPRAQSLHHQEDSPSLWEF